MDGLSSASGGEGKQGWVLVFEHEGDPGLVVVLGVFSGVLSMLAFYDCDSCFVSAGAEALQKGSAGYDER